jgi:hypothetical protein
MIFRLLMFFVVWSILIAGSARAQIASYYTDKTIPVYVGNPAGSSYDFYARLLAKHYGRQLPGNPKIVVSNFQNDLLAAKAIYSISTNKIVIGNFDPAMFVKLKAEGVYFGMKWDDFSWIGGISRDHRICYVSYNDNPIAYMGANSFGSSFIYSTIFVKYFSDYVGKPIKIIPGYSGPSRRVAFENGELNLDCAGLPNVSVEQWLNSSKAKVIFDFTEKHTINNINELDKKAISLLITPLQFRIGFQVNAKLPKDILDQLRDAYSRMFLDEQYIEEVNSPTANSYLKDSQYIDAKEIEETISNSFAASNMIVRRAKDMIDDH